MLVKSYPLLLFNNKQDYGAICLSLKKVDSQQRVNNGVFTHPETVQLL